MKRIFLIFESIRFCIDVFILGSVIYFWFILGGKL